MQLWREIIKWSSKTSHMRYTGIFQISRTDEWCDMDSMGVPGLPKLATNKNFRCPEIYCIYTVRQLRLFTAFLLSLACFHMCMAHSHIPTWRLSTLGAGGQRTH